MAVSDDDWSAIAVMIRQLFGRVVRVMVAGDSADWQPAFSRLIRMVETMWLAAGVVPESARATLATCEIPAVLWPGAVWSPDMAPGLSFASPAAFREWCLDQAADGVPEWVGRAERDAVGVTAGDVAEWLDRLVADQDGGWPEGGGVTDADCDAIAALASSVLDRRGYACWHQDGHPTAGDGPLVPTPPLVRMTAPGACPPRPFIEHRARVGTRNGGDADGQ